MCKQIAVVQAETAEKFQNAFNSKLRELEHQNPQVEFNHAQGFCAYIIYSDNSELLGIVKPANRCICDTCMRLQEPARPHVKWRKCDIYGSIVRSDNCDDYLPDHERGGDYYGN